MNGFMNWQAQLLSQARKEEWWLAAAFFALLAATTAILWPGLTGPFVLDDAINLSPLGENGGIRDWDSFSAFVFGSDTSPTGRPVSMLSFLIDAQNWPGFVPHFKYTNIMIHLLCGAALFWFAMTLFRALQVESSKAGVMSLVVTALWLLHPLNVSTTLYVVQRMTQLMTLFALLSLLCFVAGRSRLQTRPNLAMALLCCSLFPFGLLSVLSKENGSLLLLLIIAIETLIFQREGRTSLYKLWYRIGVLAPACLLFAYLAYSVPGTLEGYENRTFGVIERLLTELRVLTAYIVNILLPNTRGAGLFHDDIVVSTGLFSPLTTIFSGLFLSALLASAVTVRKAHPLYALAVGWFFTLHLLESTYVPLELYFEHRNYLPMIGPLLAVVWYGSRWINAAGESLRNIAMGGAAAVLAGMSYLTLSLSLLWSDANDLLGTWATERPASSRAQTTYAEFLVLNGDVESALEKIETARSHHPEDVSLWLVSWNLSCHLNIDPPITIAEIVAQDDLVNVRNQVTIPLREFLQNRLAGKCSFPDGDTVMSLFDRIGELDLLDNRRSEVHLYRSDMHLTYGELNSALIQLNQAYQFNPDPSLIVRQAMISASARNFEDALVFLGRAKDAQVARNTPGPLDEQIATMERDIKAIVESQ